MSELGNKIKNLRAGQPQTDFAKRSGLSLRTICKLEAGESVRLETIRQIAKALKLSEAGTLDLLVSWLKLEVGEDFQKLQVGVKEQPLAVRDEEFLPARIQMLVADTPRKFQEQLHLALQRPEVLRCLPALNDLYDSVKQRAQGS